MSDVMARNGTAAERTNLRKGQILDSGFVVLDVVDLPELRAGGIWARHEKSGAEVFHILNDDSENLFAFAFATFPDDDTGVAHILEHSVLCGSERYPLKDAFLVLAQGSLQTFLNAWTFPDKTLYPASSVNEHDYFNLMSVYGDAVFRPRLSEWTFMQEGHRFEFVKTNEDTADAGKLSITGVVYNEMKGAYSSLDTYAALWSVKAVMPGTPYAFESGGDPEHIPDLSWEGLREFHRRRYSPANCRVFLAGNIPTERQLAFLNEEFFSRLDPGAASPSIAKTGRWNAPKKLRIPCPAGGEKKLTVFLSWLCSDVTDTDENIALAALTEILLGHDGSPLTRALIESGIGEDLSPVSGMEGEIRETLFVAGLRGVDGAAEEAGKQVEDLILGELRRLVSEGIPREEIEAALLSMEFAHREIRRSGGPFSLVWMRRSLRGWLHGNKPWESLLFAPGMEKIKRRLAEETTGGVSRYFESLIQKYFIDNPHRALVVLEPKDDFLPGQETRHAEVLAKTSRGMNEEDRLEIAAKSAELEKIQSEDDSPEALAAIPHLSRNDLSAEPEIIPRRLEDLRGVPALCHELYTNGITYADLAFPLDVLAPEDYPWICLFSRAVVSVGLPGMDYGEVSSLLARTAGGFNAIPHTSSAVLSDNCVETPSGAFDLGGRDWLVYRLKCLDEKTAPSLDLALRLISEADFSDQRRIRDLVLEMKNEFDSGLAPSGHSFAAGRSGRFASRARQVEEIWGGLTQLEFSHRLAGLETAEICAKLRGLRDRIAAGGLIANLSGSALKSGAALLADRFARFGPPRPRNPAALAAAETAPSSVPAAEVFASPSLQVGFAAMTLRAAPFDSTGQVAETVLAHQLSTGALWEDIRMKGGAYGAFANLDSLEGCFSLATYRDPSPLRSLDAFRTILQNGARKRAAPSAKNGGEEDDSRQEDDLVKAIIGCYARETRPCTAAEKSLTDFFRFLTGIEDGYRQRKLERLIALSGSDIAAVFQALASQNALCPVIIAGTKSAGQAAKALGTEMNILPV
ncbi:MAG: insulinase family protein [Treponema sp.]|jgi:Zn-dependent M16 (insulinase) family peptidase|nr:insulinase family protein [Treponema sp.]